MSIFDEREDEKSPLLKKKNVFSQHSSINESIKCAIGRMSASQMQHCDSGDEILILRPRARSGPSYPGHQTLCVSGAGFFLTSLIALAAGVLFFTLSFSRRVSINLPRQGLKYPALSL